jgi:hypothetical protein
MAKISPLRYEMTNLIIRYIIRVDLTSIHEKWLIQALRFIVSVIPQGNGGHVCHIRIFTIRFKSS